jgi:hypothetical protein
MGWLHSLQHMDLGEQALMLATMKLLMDVNKFAANL